MPSIDQLDRGIMELLRQDGRMTNSEIANHLGVAEGTVRQRIRKLLDSGVFRIAGHANPDVMPDHQVCVIGLNVEESPELERCARAVSGLAEVRSVAIVTGRYDLLVEVVVPSNSGLVGFLTGPLAQVSGIRSTETFLLLKSLGKWI